MNAYTIAMCSTLVAMGALADRFGRKRVFMIGIVVFGGASLICGLASSAQLLIAARFLRGVSAAAMLSCQVAVLSHQFQSGPERGVAFAWWGVVFGLGLGFGPIVGGIGLNVARALTGAGAFCYVTGRNEEDGRRTQELLGENARFVATDVTNEGAVAGLFDLIDNRHGRLDLAVNNAGVTTRRAAVRELDLNEWKRVLDINLVGPLMLMSHELRLMARSEHASIVNVSSCGGVLGQPRQSAYSTSKAALNMLTQVAAIESAYPPEGQNVVRVNAVCPGPTLGGMNTEERLRANPESTLEKIHSTAMKRFANPEEITAAILWLLSEQASYVTGALLSVDGGFAAGKF